MHKRTLTFKDKAMIKLAHLYPAPQNPNMKHLPVVVVGANLGSIFTKKFVHHSNGLEEQMIVFGNSFNELYSARYFMEETRMALSNYMLGSKFGVENSAISQEGTYVEKYLPEENAVLLANGQKFTYDHLVIAQGRKIDWGQIKGFADAYKSDAPVYSSVQHPDFAVTSDKHKGWIFNFKSGDAYFYIPPFPHKGEVGAYNFLAAADHWNLYKELGIVSPKSTFTVINANDTFAQFEPETDALFKTYCEKYGINVKFNTKLEEIDAGNRKITITSSGNTESVNFDHLYVVPPCQPHQNLVDAGLATAESNFLLDVDYRTLQARNHDNIWGLGEVNNLPSTATFSGGLVQSHVIANNVHRSLENLPLNCDYNGFAESNILTGRHNMTKSIYDYQGARSSSLSSPEGFMSQVAYYSFAKSKLKSFQGIYEGKKTHPEGKKVEKIAHKKDSKPVLRTNTYTETPEYTPVA